MNFCHRCKSSYEKPGTCNCFAEGGDAQPARVEPVVPSLPPYVVLTPYWVWPYWDAPSTGGWPSGTWTADTATHIVWKLPPE